MARHLCHTGVVREIAGKEQELIKKSLAREGDASPPEDLMNAPIPILLTPVMGALGPLSRPSPSPQRSILL